MAAQVLKQNGATMVMGGNAAVDIRQNDRAGKEWHCFARIGKDYHGAFAGKVYKSEATAVRAATKWIEKCVEQWAAEAAEPPPPPPGPTPAWLESVYEQWETGDVAEIRETLPKGRAL